MIGRIPEVVWKDFLDGMGRKPIARKAVALTATTQTECIGERFNKHALRVQSHYEVGTSLTVRCVLQEVANSSFPLNTLRISYYFVRDELCGGLRKFSCGQLVRVRVNLPTALAMRRSSGLHFEQLNA
jgi:hypothetical protein